MSITGAAFYNFPHVSYASRTAPLFRTTFPVSDPSDPEATPTAVDTAYRIHVETAVKWLPNYDISATEITVPYFVNWQNANMLYILNRWYWVVSGEYNSMGNAANSSIKFQVKICMMSSFMRVNDTIKGRYDRIPASDSGGNAIRHETLADDEFVEVARKMLPTLGTDPKDTSYHFFQVNVAHKDASGVHTDINFIKAKIYTSGLLDYIKIDDPVYSRYASASDYDRYFTLDELIDQSITIYGSDIVDMSITDKTTVDSLIIDPTGTVTVIKIPSPTPTGWSWHVHGGFTNVVSILAPVCAEVRHTIDVDLGYATSEKWKMATMQIALMNNSNSAMSYLSIDDITVPTVGTLTGHMVIKTKVRYVHDISGISTTVTINDTATVTIPEGKIPYVTTGWQEYSALSMNYDREMLNLALNEASDKLLSDTLSNGANSVLIGGITGSKSGSIGGLMSFGASTIASGINAKIDRQYSIAEQEAKEHNMKQQPGSNYNTSYGLSYIVSALYGLTAGFAVSLPKNCDSDKFNAYTAEYGFRDDGYIKTISVIEGYYQGKVIDFSSSTGLMAQHQGGYLKDTFNDELTRGIKMLIMESE